jgi:hypothetical protein
MGDKTIVQKVPLMVMMLSSVWNWNHMNTLLLDNMLVGYNNVWGLLFILMKLRPPFVFLSSLVDCIVNIYNVH